MKLFFIVLFLASSTTFSYESSYFPNDEVRKERVAFWIKVYSQISESEGFLHDPEDLGIIYKQVSVEGMSRRESKRFIEKEKENIEKEILGLLKNGASNGHYDGLLEIKTPEELHKMAKRVRWQSGLSNRFKEGLERSYLYLDHIKEIFKREGVPLELAYLPHVESSFQYEAYSKVGAAGIWQFMRSTARLFRMKMDYVYDERLDPLKAASAAAKLLKVNYQKLGTWPLAITAYNHGAAGVEKAIRSVGSNKIRDLNNYYSGKRYGFASQNFYACFVAALEIALNPNNYFQDVKPQAVLEFDDFIVPKTIRINNLIASLNISVDDFKRFNRSFRRNAYTNNGFVPKGITIHLPKNTISDLAEASTKILNVKEEQLSESYSGTHVVSVGETLSQIATYYKITLGDLIQANELLNPSRIFPGVRLKIPENNSTFKPVKKVKVEKQKDFGWINNDEDIVSKMISLTWPDSKLFPIEDIINITLFEGVTKTVAESIKLETDITKTYDLELKKISQNLYSVKVELDETLGHYADWSGVRVSTIQSYNFSRGRTIIREGDYLKIPIPDKSVSSFNSKRLEYHSGIEEDFFENYKIVQRIEYVVKKGDTLANILNDQQIPLWLFRKMQKNYSDKLFVGQSISIPIVEPIGQGSSILQF